MSFLMHVVAHVPHYLVFVTTLPYLFIHSSNVVAYVRHDLVFDTTLPYLFIPCS